MALLEERRKKLLAEGLFAAERKRPLPYLPRVIGVVTSPTGAVIRDILHRLDDRFPTHVLVWPVRVQGDTCCRRSHGAIEGFNASPMAARSRARTSSSSRAAAAPSKTSGASTRRIVVRAVAASRIPVISAVGHETDTTLDRLRLRSSRADAHRRRRSRRAGPQRTHRLCRRSGPARRDSVRKRISGDRDRLRAAAGELPRPLDLLNLARQRVDLAASQLASSLRHLGQQKRIALGRVAPHLRPPENPPPGPPSTRAISPTSAAAPTRPASHQRKRAVRHRSRFSIPWATNPSSRAVSRW